MSFKCSRSTPGAIGLRVPTRGPLTLSAANALNISANGGLAGVTFDGTTTLDSLHAQVTGTAARAGITFSGTLDMPQNQPPASATFLSNRQEVAPPMI